MYLLGSVQLHSGISLPDLSPGILPLDPAGSKASSLPIMGSCYALAIALPPNRKTKLHHGHGVSHGLSETAELLVKYKLVCYWLVYWNLKFFGQHLLAQHPHWRKVSAGPVQWCLKQEPIRTHANRPPAVGQPTRPTQPFILSGL